MLGSSATPPPAPPAPAPEARPRRAQALLVIIPAAVLLALALVLAVQNGGFAVTTWYPAALFVLALAGVVAATSAAATPGWLGVRAPLLVLGLFVAWCFTTLLWSEAPGLSWDGANRTLLYALVFAIVTMRAWPVGPARWAVLTVVLAIAGLAVGVLVDSGLRADPASLFTQNRLALPLGYSNATANLWLIGCLPGLWLACDRALPWPVRGLALGASALLAQVAVLSQSRGSVVAFALAALLLVLIAPRRWPVALAIGVVVAAVAATSEPLLQVHDAPLREIGAELAGARGAILLAALAATVLGMLGALLDAGVTRVLGDRARRHGDRLLAGLGVAALVAGAVSVGNPVSWAGDRWDDFRSSGYTKVDSGGARFNGSLGSNRYDFYRVGLDEFSAHPLRGVGVDAFGPGYLRLGRSDETPRYAHSLPIALLAETGVVGALLFAGFLLLAIGAGVRARGRPHRRAPGAGPAVAALAGFAAFGFGASVDWLWQFPALGVLGFGLLGIAARTGGADAVVDPRRHGSRLAVALGSLGMIVAALSLALPGAAARFTRAAYEQSARDAPVAVERLDRAASFNRLSADPLLAKAIVLRRAGDARGAEHALDRAVEREPDNWFVYFERAMIATGLRQWSRAEADIARARELNPRQPVVGTVRNIIARRSGVDPDAAEAALAAQLARKLGPAG